MHRYDLSDESLTKLLDVAGEITREERVVYFGMPDLFVWNSPDDPVLSVTYKLPVDAWRGCRLRCRKLP